MSPFAPRYACTLTHTLGRGIIDEFATKRVPPGRLTGRQLFESDAALVFSDSVDDESGIVAPSGATSCASGAIVYAVDAALYGSDALPDEDSDDADYFPGDEDEDDDDDDGEDWS
jgi:hypothetical protein